jgi:hypothetical protein
MRYFDKRKTQETKIGIASLLPSKRKSTKPRKRRASEEVGIFFLESNGIIIDSSNPVHRHCVASAMRKIMVREQVDPDYANRLKSKLQGFLVDIPNVGEIQSLAISFVLYAFGKERMNQFVSRLDFSSILDFGVDDPTDVETYVGKPDGTAIKVPKIPDIHSAVEFMLRCGVGDVNAKNSKYFEESGSLAIYADLEIYNIIPNPNIPKKIILTFLENKLNQDDYRSYAEMFQAAKAAEKQGLIRLQYKITKELPGVIIDRDGKNQF